MNHSSWLDGGNMLRRISGVWLLLSMAVLVPGAEPTAVLKPSEVLDLSSWKLTLPTDSVRRGQADEIEAARLRTFSDAGCFFVSENRDGVVFRASCGGAVTKGSQYPRCELREMDASGLHRAAWSTDNPQRHSMSLRLAITNTPPKKKHVVCAQIHDERDDLLMIRLEGRRLFVERNGDKEVVLDDRYELGAECSLKIEAGGGRVCVLHDGVERLDWPVSRKGCYFKAGCYTQSNLKRGDTADAFGEVVIRDLRVEHQAPR